VTLVKRKPNWRKQAKSGWSIWNEKGLESSNVGDPSFQQVGSSQSGNACDAVRHMLLRNPRLTVAELSEALQQLKLPTLTPICVSSIKSHFRKSLDVIEQVGLLRNRSPELPEELLSPTKKLPKRSPKKPRQKQLPRRYDQRHGYDGLDD
jgi:hypothetical protein